MASSIRTPSLLTLNHKNIVQDFSLSHIEFGMNRDRRIYQRLCQYLPRISKRSLITCLLKLEFLLITLFMFFYYRLLSSPLFTSETTLQLKS